MSFYSSAYDFNLNRINELMPQISYYIKLDGKKVRVTS